MSAFKGSGGPWSFHEDDAEGGQIVVADNGDVVCVVGSYMTSVEEDFANGPLIAAAPELLEALQTYMAAVNQMNAAMNDGVNVQGAMSNLVGSEDMARAAIAKALGQ